MHTNTPGIAKQDILHDALCPIVILRLGAAGDQFHRLAVEASAGKIGSAVEQILLLCFHYDPAVGKYGLAIMRVLQGTGLITLLALGSFIFISLRRERRQRMAGANIPALSPGKG